MSKKDEALKLAFKALILTPDPSEENMQAVMAIRKALAETPPCKYPHCPYPCPDLPDCRDAEQPAKYSSKADTEELLKLNDLPEPLRFAAMLEKTMQWPLHGKAADCLRKMHAALASQPAQQQEPVRVPVTDNTYNYAKSLAEAIFKQHFASDEHYASGRIVWGVNDTVIGILTQIDNMVADMVRRPAQQQEPVFWYRPCSNGMYEGPIHNAQIERVRKESGAWHPLYTSPPASKPEPTEKLVSAAGLALEVLKKHRQMKGEYPVGMLGVRAVEEIEAAFREIDEAAHAKGDA